MAVFDLYQLIHFSPFSSFYSEFSIMQLSQLLWAVGLTALYASGER